MKIEHWIRKEVYASELEEFRYTSLFEVNVRGHGDQYDDIILVQGSFYKDKEGLMYFRYRDINGNHLTKRVEEGMGLGIRAVYEKEE